MLSESYVEQVALSWLCSLGYQHLYGVDIAPGTRSAERAYYGQVLLVGRLRSALLPKRISGLLRVPDAEWFVAGTVMYTTLTK